MDLPTPKYFQSPPIFESNGDPPLEGRRSFYGKTKDDPFADTFHDPLCKLNLKETSEFVKSLPMVNTVTSSVSTQRRRDGVNSVTTQRRVAESPSTPGRPVFGFSVGNLSRKNVPSKWDEAEKWLVCSPCNDSPAHSLKPSEPTKISKQAENFKPQTEVFAEKFRVTEEKVSKAVSSFLGSATLCKNNSNSLRPFNGVSDLHLKDKFMDNVEPNLPTKEGFVFSNSAISKMEVTGAIVEVQHRDIGTEMTPLGSSTTSRCPTPFKSSSPARHNTPANRSGPLGLVGAGDDADNNSATIDITQLQECHLAKLQLPSQYDSVASNWSSREEEEEEISKSLRHFETGNECRRSISDSRAAAWEEEEKTQCCNSFRYQREEARIQAWVNLQNAKAEAQSKKLEVKIERMRSNLEGKLMKRLSMVHRKAEEWREAARQQHTHQIEKATEEAKKLNWRRPYSLPHNTTSCGCFPTYHS
ncbi:uncharacterized protein LOC111788816 isoform X1 [Cucurbita pepo subsp. pepo]|uniref:uncharacterized protein LOC111788816 isoform X1 n=1 Tax=Cucurbita pepo subsp. pepo TaxID=3664 RepID=UPI000C9D9D88|nr:uncharacterized protein LOC111788816 isoform X1 [Cucurbita pepo subsp. pepo]